jgi:hypothetical protein
MDDENSSTSISWWTGADLASEDALVFTDGLALGVGMVESATASRILSETRWKAPNRGRLGNDSGEAKSMASISIPRGVEGRSRGEPMSSAPVIGAVWYRFSGDLLLLRVTVSGRAARVSVSSREATTGLLNCLKWSCMPDGRTGATSSADGLTGDEESRSTTSGGPDVFRAGETILGLALLGGDNCSGEGRFEDRFWGIIASRLRSTSGIEGVLLTVLPLRSSSATGALVLNELLFGAGFALCSLDLCFAIASILVKSSSSHSGDLDLDCAVRSTPGFVAFVK